MHKLAHYQNEQGDRVTIMVDVPGLARLTTAAKRNPGNRTGTGPFLIQLEKAERKEKKHPAPDCPQCLAAQRASNDDSTTAGFFYDRCAKHREEQLAAAPAEQLRSHLKRLRKGFANILEVRAIAQSEAMWGETRYGAMTRQEIEQTIEGIDQVLKDAL